MNNSYHNLINQSLKGFKIYMRIKKYAKTSVEMNCRYVTEYLIWLQSENLNVETVGYNDILAFVDYCRSNENSWTLTNHKLLAVRHYYNHLTNRKDVACNVSKNPAAGIILKVKTKRVINNLLDRKQLDELYEKYQETTTQKHYPEKYRQARIVRNKVMLGLLIYQGLTTEELHLLKPEFVKLNEGKIIIPATKRTNGRTLKLEANQILNLAEYIHKVRPQICKDVACNVSTANQLLISIEGSPNLKPSLHHLFIHLKKINPQAKDGKQIRKSVIVNWLKEHNLREVQYFAGHRHISSTERYQQENLDDLQKEIEKYHPLK